MKKLFTIVAALFATSTIETMDRNTLNKLKSASFDSFDEDNYDDDNYDDSYDDTYEPDNYAGKKRPARRPMPATGGFKPTSGYFTIQIVNGIAGAQTVELFNSLRNAVNAVNSELFAGFVPFTAVNRAAANLNSVIYFNAAGDMIIQSAAGTLLTVSCKQIPYRTLIESLKFYRIQVAKTKISFTNEPQLDNDITYSQQTFLGKKEVNTFTPRVYFADNQFQSKQVTINQGYVIDGERGLSFTVNQGETMSINLTLSGIMKG
jgi:hypothetical protein